jgi:uncharacterized protein (DUF2461 family)
MPTSPPKFTGFSKETLQFLVELEKNNRREWFNEHKAFYKETVEEELRRLVWSTSGALAKKKIPLSTEPKNKLCRFYKCGIGLDRRTFQLKKSVERCLACEADRSGTAQRFPACFTFLHSPIRPQP